MSDFLSRLNEFSIPDGECWLYSMAYGKEWTCDIKVRHDDDKFEFKGKGLDPESAFDEAYSKYRRLIDRAPEYNPNKTIEHQPVEEYDDSPRDDIGF